jgi:DNA-binding NtrC family response regulator
VKEPAIRPATILVVDDEPLIRWSLAERLRADGHAVLEADDGRSALEQFSDDVDAVTLDYKLPDMDGLSILRHMRARNPQILVMFLTAYATAETAAEAMALGVFHFAKKPFDLDDISRRVREAIEAKRFRSAMR